MKGSMAIRQLRKLLREYDAVLVGRAGIEQAYKGFLNEWNIKPLLPTKAQSVTHRRIGAFLDSFGKTGTTTGTSDSTVELQWK